MDSYTSESAVAQGIELASSPRTEVALAADIRVREPLRFPAEDGGRSLQEMAQRDLDAALQLLAERAQYITGASGAAIALGDADGMLCRASSGPSAPKVGSTLQANSGLSGESVRTGQVLCCNNAMEDPRVDHESCRALGIASAMAMPLLRDEKVIGIFEIFSSRPHAFEERDLIALQRLGEMILTAVDHAEAAFDAHTLIAAAGIPEPFAAVPDTLPLADSLPAPRPSLVPNRGNIGSCSSCGFPVSEGRTLCLDCENSIRPAGQALHSSLIDNSTDWVLSHKYLVGTVVAAVIAVAVIFFR